MNRPKALNDSSVIELRVRFSCNNIYFGPGAARLLELIDEGESVREACSLMKMSYSKGWKILNMIKQETGYDPVVRHQGGAKGGKTELSTEGIELLNAFRKIEKEIKDFANERFNYYLGQEDD